MTPGYLRYIGFAKLGAYAMYSWFQCITCNTTYPVVDGQTSCNGKSITLCPWCREDSKPWANGRGA